MKNMLDEDHWRIIEGDLATLKAGKPLTRGPDPAVSAVAAMMPMLGRNR